MKMSIIISIYLIVSLSLSSPPSLSFSSPSDEKTRSTQLSLNLIFIDFVYFYEHFENFTFGILFFKYNQESFPIIFIVLCIDQSRYQVHSVFFLFFFLLWKRKGLPSIEDSISRLIPISYKNQTRKTFNLFLSYTSSLPTCICT